MLQEVLPQATRTRQNMGKLRVTLGTVPVLCIGNSKDGSSRWHESALVTIKQDCPVTVQKRLPRTL